LLTDILGHIPNILYFVKKNMMSYVKLEVMYAVLSEKDQAMATGNFVKFGHVVFEICDHTTPRLYYGPFPGLPG